MTGIDARRLLGNRTMHALVVTLCFLVIVGALSIYTTFIYLDSSRWVSRTDNIVADFESIQRYMDASRTPNDDPSVLKDHGLSEVEFDLGQIKQLTSSNPVQQQRLKTLSPLLRDYLQRLNSHGGTTQRPTYAQFQTIEQLTSRIENNELDLLRTHMRRSDRAGRQAIRADAAGFGFLLVFLVCVVLFAARDQQLRHRAQIDLDRAYQRELRITSTLQGSFLMNPRDDLFEGLVVRTHYEAALGEAEVGGDFFDAFSLPGGLIAVVLGDVLGKGLTAAARTAEVKFTLRALVHEYPHPSRAMDRLNGILCEAEDIDELPTALLTCLTLAIVNPTDDTVTVAVAGMEPPVLLRANGVVDKISADGLPLAVSSDFQYHSLQAKMCQGDVLLLVTDGMLEARNDSQFLGLAGVVDLAQTALPLRDLGEVARKIVFDAREYAGGDFHDDVCLLLAGRV